MSDNQAESARTLVDAERIRQRSRWSREHDAEHGPETLLRAAACYEAGRMVWPGWPWDAQSWRPRDPMRNLVKAGALYQAAADCCPRRLAYLRQLERAVEGRQRCEQAIDQMLAGRPSPPGAAS